MAPRAAKQLLRLHAPVALAEAASPAAAGALLEALAKHVLYIHGQIPGPYDALAAEALGPSGPAPGRCRKASRRRTMLRRTRKLVASFDLLFGALPRALAAVQPPGSAHGGSPPLVAALVLGGSLASPRAVFLVRGHAGPTAAAPSAAELRGLQRRLVRELVRVRPTRHASPSLNLSALSALSPPAAPHSAPGVRRSRQPPTRPLPAASAAAGASCRTAAEPVPPTACVAAQAAPRSRLLCRARRAACGGRLSLPRRGFGLVRRASGRHRPRLPAHLRRRRRRSAERADLVPRHGRFAARLLDLNLS